MYTDEYGDEEMWRTHPVYSNYAVSTWGRVMNAKRGTLLTTFNKGMFSPYRVTIRHEGKTLNKLVHRLVAETFFTRYAPYRKVRHKDGDIHNNHYLNLEFTNGEGYGFFRGGEEGIAQKALYCVETGDRYYSVQEASKALKTSPVAIYKAISGERPHAKGKTFKWSDYGN